MALIIKPYTMVEAEENVHFCVCSPDTKWVACALGSGAIHVLNARTLATLSRGAPGKDFAGSPATCVRWMPNTVGGEWQLVSSSTSGGVLLWSCDRADATLRRDSCAREDRNEVMTVDVSPNGRLVVSAGSDRVVRLYDATLQLLSKLVDGVNADGSRRPTHINRIFSARFLNDAVALTAGWESPVQVWDLRLRCSNRQVRSVQGSSDCLEPITGTHLVVAASPKAPNTLRLLDSVTGRVMEENSTKACAQLHPEERVMVCRFCADSGLVWCLTVSPPSLIVLALSSGDVLARAALPAQPLNMTQQGNDVLVGCKGGVLLQAVLSM